MPRARTPQDDITPRDLDGVPFYAVTSISVNEWHELPDGKGPPSQVHLWIELEGVEAPLAVRFKSPRGIDELIVALMTHRKNVWPIQVPSSDFRDDSQFEN